MSQILHTDIDPAARACAWLMIQFPGISRRVITDVLGAYRDQTPTLSAAYDAARERLADACRVE